MPTSAVKHHVWFGQINKWSFPRLNVSKNHHNGQRSQSQQIQAKTLILSNICVKRNENFEYCPNNAQRTLQNTEVHVGGVRLCGLHGFCLCLLPVTLFSSLPLPPCVCVCLCESCPRGYRTYMWDTTVQTRPQRKVVPFTSANGSAPLCVCVRVHARVCACMCVFSPELIEI